MTTRTQVLVAPPPWRQWFVELWWVLQSTDALFVLTLRDSWRALGRIPAIARLPLATVALGTLLGIKALLSYLADPRPLLWILAAPVIALGVFALFCGWAWAMSGRAPAISFHGHGPTRALAETHERRHVKVLNGLKISHHGYRVWREGGDYAGRTYINRSAANMRRWRALRSEEKAAVYMAGAMGPEGNYGCTSDLAEVDALSSRAKARRVANRYL